MMPAARAAASSRRKGLACRARAPTDRAPKTKRGTSASSVMRLEKKRVRHTETYGSPTSSETAPASTREERTGPSMPPPTTTAATRASVSKRAGASLKARTATAPIRASRQFVAKSTNTRLAGEITGSSTTRWAGKAASREIHQRRGGARTGGGGGGGVGGRTGG